MSFMCLIYSSTRTSCVMMTCGLLRRWKMYFMKAIHCSSGLFSLCSFMAVINEINQKKPIKLNKKKHAFFLHIRQTPLYFW